MRGNQAKDLAAAVTAAAAAAAVAPSSKASKRSKALKKTLCSLFPATVTAKQNSPGVGGISSLKNLFQSPSPAAATAPERSVRKKVVKSSVGSGNGETKRREKVSICSPKAQLQQGKVSLDSMKAQLQQGKKGSVGNKEAQLQKEKVSIGGMKAQSQQGKGSVGKKEAQLQQEKVSIGSMKAQLQQEKVSVANMEAQLQQGENGTLGDITKEICQILDGNSEKQSIPSLQGFNNGMEINDIFSFSRFSNSSFQISERRKDLQKERKAKFIANYRKNQFDQLVRICSTKLGTESTFKVLTKLGRETGISECKSLISLYIKEARSSSNEESSLKEIKGLIMLLKFICQQGFEINEEIYGPILSFLVEKKMTQEFNVSYEIVKKENPKSIIRMGYYYMLLCIKIGDEAKIEELCNTIKISDNEDTYQLAESYLLALCKRDRKKEILQLLKMIDIKNVSSEEYVVDIFKSLGRLLLDNVAEDLILTLKSKENGEGNVSLLIFHYVSCLPNLTADELSVKFSLLHNNLGVVPSTTAYDKLIGLCCSDMFKVPAVVNVINQMCEFGLSPSIGNFDSIFAAIEQSGECDLVRPIYTVMCQNNLVPKDDTVRSLINCFTKMGDFVDVYRLLDYLKERNKKPTTSMYNTILAGYFRKNDTHGVSLVLKQMKVASVELDAETYAYLIINCKCKEDIVKYHVEMKKSEVEETKHVLMALINAYANCGMFDEAKQVILDDKVSVKMLNDCKPVLVSALATNGKVSDALELYDEIRQAGFSIPSKTTIALIEYMRSEGELERLLQLREDLDDLKHWLDASGRIVLYCLQFDLVTEAVELLKQMKEKDEVCVCSFLDQACGQLWERELPNIKTGLKLLQAIEEDLQLSPSRTSLDFLLSACAKARDVESAQFIWAEYTKFDLPFNTLSFLRMYQVLLATGEFKAANNLLEKVPKNDPHVRVVIRACQTSYSDSGKPQEI